jgi:hypothetical protein
MGTLAESFGIVQGLKYRTKIRDELERVLSIEAGWQGGSAEAAIGQWYYEVPRLLGGSATKAEAHFRRALSYDAQNLLALSFLAELLASNRQYVEARALLQRVLDAPLSTEWAPEDRDFKRQAAERLTSLGSRPQPRITTGTTRPGTSRRAPRRPGRRGPAAPVSARPAAT